ncbi:MAG: ArsO family NAD(P)H-dependent flavin-containing monooxygenase [bacterium]|nr:ArsO family NAD(P)H-dependent flavin-containing monooxygenase [bacterium]
MNEVDVVVIGGGQTGLATAYFLRRTGLSFVLLDGEDGPGGAWRHTWRSLRLFSPAAWSSIAGRKMPSRPDGYPTRDDVIDYLAEYEQRYRLPVERPVRVDAVRPEGERLMVSSASGQWLARAVVSTTGTWGNAYIPPYKGVEDFTAQQMHSADYVDAASFANKRVLVIGGGNSGAQILAEVSKVASTKWITLEEPRYLGDDVDGRVLFDRVAYLWTTEDGRVIDSIVMVPPVKEARERGMLRSMRPFDRFTPTGVIWPDGAEEKIDAIIWCTGYRPALGHLKALDVIQPDGCVQVDGTRSVKHPNLWLVGYGDWTGAASATLTGVTDTARSTVAEIKAALAKDTTGAVTR